MSATVTERIREDGTKEITVRPEPAVFSISTFLGGGATSADLLRAVRTMLANGVKVTLTPEGREMLGGISPEALALLEGGK